MNWEIVAGLLKLANKPKYEEKIKSIIESEDIEGSEEWKSKYRYFGEALEREEGILEEKILAYALAKRKGFAPLTINGYQIKAFEKILQKEKDNQNPYVRFAFFLMDEGNISHFDNIPLTMEEFSIIRYIFRGDIAINVIQELDILIYNITDMLKSPCICKDISASRKSYNCIKEVFSAVFYVQCVKNDKYIVNENKKMLINMQKLCEGKVSASAIKYLTQTFDISGLDVICLNFYILQLMGTARSATNAFVYTLNALAEAEDDWNNLQKAVFDYICAIKYMPGRIEKENAVKYVFTRENVIKKMANINNHNYALDTDGISNNILSSYTFDITMYPEKMHNKYFENIYYASYLFAENIKNKNADEIERIRNIFEANSRYSLWELIEAKPGLSILNSLEKAGYIDVFEEYKNGNMEESVIAYYAKFSRGTITYKLLKDYYESDRPKEIISLVSEFIPQYRIEKNTNFYLNTSAEINKKFINIVARSYIANEQFDRLGFLLVNILYNKDYSLQVYSEEELKSLLKAIPDILACYKKPEYRSSDNYLCKEHIDIISVLYMTDEEKIKYEEYRKNHEIEENIKKLKEEVYSREFQECDSDAYKAACLIERVIHFNYGKTVECMVIKDIYDKYLCKSMVLSYDDICYIIKTLRISYCNEVITWKMFKDTVEKIELKTEETL